MEEELSVLRMEYLRMSREVYRSMERDDAAAEREILMGRMNDILARIKLLENIDPKRLMRD